MTQKENAYTIVAPSEFRPHLPKMVFGPKDYIIESVGRYNIELARAGFHGRFRIDINHDDQRIIVKQLLKE